VGASGRSAADPWPDSKFLKREHIAKFFWRGRPVAAEEDVPASWNWLLTVRVARLCLLQMIHGGQFPSFCAGARRWSNKTRDSPHLASSRRTGVSRALKRGCPWAESCDFAVDGRPAELPPWKEPLDGEGAVRPCKMPSFSGACSCHEMRTTRRKIRAFFEESLGVRCAGTARGFFWLGVSHHLSFG